METKVGFGFNPCLGSTLTIFAGVVSEKETTLCQFSTTHGLDFGRNRMRHTDLGYYMAPVFSKLSLIFYTLFRLKMFTFRPQAVGIYITANILLASVRDV
jgi:hypothetical protein